MGWTFKQFGGIPLEMRNGTDTGFELYLAGVLVATVSIATGSPVVEIEGSLTYDGDTVFAHDVAVTEELTVTGDTAFTGQISAGGQIFAADGTSALPGYSFTNDPDTGMFRNRADEIAFSTGGVSGLAIHDDGDVWIRAGVAMGTGVYAPSGTRGAPSYTFLMDSDSGIFQPAANTLAFNAGGASAIYLSGGNTVLAGNISVAGSGQPHGGTVALSSVAQGALGTITWDANYLYFKTAAEGMSGWKSIAFSAW